jgi:hypothetical protein
MLASDALGSCGRDEAMPLMLSRYRISHGMRYRHNLLLHRLVLPLLHAHRNAAFPVDGKCEFIQSRDFV